MSAFTLTISVPTGDPNDLKVVEVSNWVGRGLFFARKPSEAVKSNGLGQSGVYLLTGEALEGDVSEQICIGESENVYDRLRTHERKPELDFWTKTYCLTTSNNSLNKGHLRYMESELIRRARDSATWSVVNANVPTSTPLAKSDEIAARSYLDTMFQVATIMGITAFDQPRTLGGDQLHLVGPDAKAIGEAQDGGFLVFAGSLARMSETKTLQDSVRDLRKRLLRDGRFITEGKSLRLTHDHLFPSPSTAAAVLLARSANGRTEWKNSLGVTLKDIQLADS